MCVCVCVCRFWSDVRSSVGIGSGNNGSSCYRLDCIVWKTGWTLVPLFEAFLSNIRKPSCLNLWFRFATFPEISARVFSSLTPEGHRHSLPHLACRTCTEICPWELEATSSKLWAFHGVFQLVGQLKGLHSFALLGGICTGCRAVAHCSADSPKPWTFATVQIHRLKMQIMPRWALVADSINRSPTSLVAYNYNFPPCLHLFVVTYFVYFVLCHKNMGHQEGPAGGETFAKRPAQPWPCLLQSWQCQNLVDWWLYGVVLYRLYLGITCHNQWWETLY